MDRVKALWQRLRLLTTFGRVLRSDDSGPLQILQIEGLVGELRDGVVRIGEWGFASNPPANAQAVVIALGGDRGQLVAIGVEDRNTRPKNQAPGTSGIYGLLGTRVRCLPDGTVEIVGPVGSITISPTGAITINGLSLASTIAAAITVNAAGAVNLTAGGVVNLTGSSVVLGPATTIDGKSFLAHTHTSTAPGTPTSAVN